MAPNILNFPGPLNGSALFFCTSNKLFWFQSFSVELLESDVDVLSEENVLELVKKASGANYGTGTRD